jgi:hypothetical protein
MKDVPQCIADPPGCCGPATELRIMAACHVKIRIVFDLFFGRSSFGAKDDLVGAAHFIGGKVGEGACEGQAIGQLCHDKAVFG